MNLLKKKNDNKLFVEKENDNIIILDKENLITICILEDSLNEQNDYEGVFGNKREYLIYLHKNWNIIYANG